VGALLSNERLHLTRPLVAHLAGVRPVSKYQLWTSDFSSVAIDGVAWRSYE